MLRNAYMQKNELEEPFAKVAIDKNFQAAASKINIRCKE